MALTSEQRQELGRLLERERAKLVRRLRRFGEDLGSLDSSAGLSQHMADAAAALTERETAFLMANEEGRRLVEVNRALDRLSRSPETFGICRSCGGEIAFERLEALPHTELCIACKNLEEAGDGRSA
jgi:DnaK suppressor protein